MKKILILTLIVFLIPTKAKTQLFEGGIIGGLTGAQIDGDTYGGYKHIGLHISIFSKLKIKKKISIIAGVGYIQKGARQAAETIFFSTNLHYAEIPLLIDYQLFEKISLTTGLTTGYLINGHQKTNYGKLSEKDLSLKRMDFSYYLSLNYSLSDKLSLRFANNYSIFSITYPTSGKCINSNLLKIILSKPTNSPCWLNNILNLSIQYKIWNNKTI